MERTLIDQLKNHINEEVLIKGRVMNVRGLSNVKFVLVQDYKGLVQTVWETEIFARIGDAVEVIGEVREDKRAKGGVEIFGKELKIWKSVVGLAFG